MTEREDMSRIGYSKEDEYFYRVNKELLEKRRKELDAAKSGQADHTREPWWMRCCKCGARMNEIDLSGIKIDQCSGCKGLYFDAGELETVLKSKEQAGFLGLIRKIF